MARNISSPIHSYEDALEAFKARKQRTRPFRLAANTYLVEGPQADPDNPNGAVEDCPSYFAVRFHNTNIVTFHANGDVTLDTGGWKTRTTLHRMRGFFPASDFPSDEELRKRSRFRWSLACERGEWSAVCERVSILAPETPGEETWPRYRYEVVKSFPLHRTLTLQRAPRTAGGFKLKRETVETV